MVWVEKINLINKNDGTHVGLPIIINQRKITYYPVSG
jgi:hypothetical protein